VLCAFLSDWLITSIDPQMHVLATRQRLMDGGVRRVAVIGERVQDIEIEPPTGLRIALMVHAHVDVPTVTRALRPDFTVSMPCCVKDNATPDMSYEDDAVLSPHKRVNVYTRKEA